MLEGRNSTQSQSAFHFFQNHFQKDERKGIPERASLLYFSEEKIDHVVIYGIRNPRSTCSHYHIPLSKPDHQPFIVYIGDTIILTDTKYIYIEYTQRGIQFLSIIIG